MYITGNGHCHDAPCIQSETVNVFKRLRDEAEEGIEAKRPRREDGSDKGDATRTRVSGDSDSEITLIALPCDVLSVIMGSLSLSAFANLAIVCKAVRAMPWSPELGRATITEMGCAFSGRDILAAVRGNTPMRADWQTTLYLSFARKVQTVELHDHALLTAVWAARLAGLRANADVMAYPAAKSDLDALNWFMTAPSQRDSLCAASNNKHHWVVLASDVPALKAFPGPCLTRILEGLSPLYWGTRVYYQMVAEVSQDVALNGRAHSKVSLPLAIDLAIEMYEDGSGMTEIRDKLGEYFGVSESALRQTIDAIMGEIIPHFTYENDAMLDRECERWHPDEGFRSVVEEAYLRSIKPRQFRGDDFSRLVNDYDSDALKQQMDARIRMILFQFETWDGAIFGGDGALQAEVLDLGAAISQSDVTMFVALYDASQTLPYRVAPFLMQQLASHVPNLAVDGEHDVVLLLDKLAFFDDLLAWRDRVVEACQVSQEWALAASAYAAPLSVWARPECVLDPLVRTKLSAAADAGFAALPPHLWQEILENLLGYPQLASEALFDADRRRALMQQFIREAATTLFRASDALTDDIIKYAVPIWETLPDRAAGSKSRFDVFSDRFGLSFWRRQALRSELLESIGERVEKGEYTLHQGVQRAGLLHDGAAMRQIENQIWHSVLREVAKRPDKAQAMMAYAHHSANLRDRAAIYSAGATGELRFS